MERGRRSSMRRYRVVVVRPEILPTGTRFQHCPSRSSSRKSRQRPSPSDRRRMGGDIRRDIGLNDSRIGDESGVRTWRARKKCSLFRARALIHIREIPESRPLAVVFNVRRKESALRGRRRKRNGKCDENRRKERDENLSRRGERRTCFIANGKQYPGKCILEIRASVGVTRGGRVRAILRYQLIDESHRYIGSELCPRSSK